jgi:hypothetical protein
MHYSWHIFINVYKHNPLLCWFLIWWEIPIIDMDHNINVYIGIYLTRWYPARCCGMLVRQHKNYISKTITEENKRYKMEWSSKLQGEMLKVYQTIILKCSILQITTSFPKLWQNYVKWLQQFCIQMVQVSKRIISKKNDGSMKCEPKAIWYQHSRCTNCWPMKLIGAFCLSTCRWGDIKTLETRAIVHI